MSSTPVTNNNNNSSNQQYQQHHQASRAQTADKKPVMYGYKQRQQSAPSQQGVNGAIGGGGGGGRARSLTQQYNVGYGHKILTRQDNPTVNVSRLHNPMHRPPSNQTVGHHGGVPAATPLHQQGTNKLQGGRKVVPGSSKNTGSAGSAKQRLGSYAQGYSVINQSALTAIGVGGKKDQR